MMEIKLYEIVVCNLGYNNYALSSLDGKQFTTLSEAQEELNDILIPELEENEDKIDGHEILYKNLEINHDEFNEDGIADVIRTDNYNRCIYIKEV